MIFPIQCPNLPQNKTKMLGSELASQFQDQCPGFRFHEVTVTLLITKVGPVFRVSFS